MKTHILRGSKQQIAETVARIDGDVREAIVFVLEPSDVSPPAQDLFAEMEPFTVRQGGVDYSRESFYRRAEGE